MSIKTANNISITKNFFSGLKGIFSPQQRISLPKTPEAILSRLDSAFNLKLDIIPNQRQNLLDKITQTSIEMPLFLEKLHKCVEIDPIRIQPIILVLKLANLELFKAGHHYRLREFEPRKNNSLLIDVSPVPIPEVVTPEGIQIETNINEYLYRGIYCCASEGGKQYKYQDDHVHLWRKKAIDYFVKEEINDLSQIELVVPNHGALILFTDGSNDCKISLKSYRGESVTVKAEIKDNKRLIIIFGGEEIIYEGVWDRQNAKMLRVDKLLKFRMDSKQFFIGESDKVPGEIETRSLGTLHVFRHNGKDKSINLYKLKGKTITIRPSMENGKRYILIIYKGEIIYKKYWDAEIEEFVDPLSQFRYYAAKYYINGEDRMPGDVLITMPKNGTLNIFTHNGKTNVISLRKYANKSLHLSPLYRDGERLLVAKYGDQVVWERYWDEKEGLFVDEYERFRIETKKYYLDDDSIIPKKTNKVVSEYGLIGLWTYRNKDYSISLAGYSGKEVTLYSSEEDGKKWLTVVYENKIIYRRYWDKKDKRFVDPVNEFFEDAKKYYLLDEDKFPQKTTMLNSDRGLIYMWKHGENGPLIILSEYAGKYLTLCPLEEDGKKWLTIICENKIIYKRYWEKRLNRFIDPHMLFREEAEKYYTGKNNNCPEPIIVKVSDYGVIYLFKNNKYKNKPATITLHKLKGKDVKLEPITLEERKWLLVHYKDQLVYKGYWDDNNQKFVRVSLNQINSTPDKLLNESESEYLFLWEILQQSRDQDIKADQNEEIERIKLEIK